MLIKKIQSERKKIGLMKKISTEKVTKNWEKEKKCLIKTNLKFVYAPKGSQMSP